MPAPTITVSGKCGLGHDWNIVFTEDGITKTLGKRNPLHASGDTEETKELDCPICANDARKASQYHGWEE